MYGAKLPRMDKSELDFVLEQLQERKGSWMHIAKDTGMPYSWLSKLARGVIDDPGVKKIEKLASYFRLLERQENERAAHCATPRQCAA
jgi:predicted transcriptional regulator